MRKTNVLYKAFFVLLSVSMFFSCKGTIAVTENSEQAEPAKEPQSEPEPVKDAVAALNVTFSVEDITITPVENDDVITLTPAAGFENYTWTFNGGELDASCSVDKNNVLTFEKLFAANGDGLYSFTLKAKKNGITYTTNAEFYLDDIESGNETGKWPGSETVQYKKRNSKMIIFGTGELSDMGFSGYENITEVFIEDGITKIGEYCFSKFNKLTAVKGCKNITEIGAYGFSDCESLETIPSFDNVTETHAGVFYNCKALTAVNGFNAITNIWHHMFEGCSALTSIKGFNSVISVWDDAFKGCTALTTVEGFNSVYSMDMSFEDCTSLKTVKEFNNTIMICKNTFKGCSSLVSIIGFSKLNIILGDVFTGCTSFEKIEFGGTEEQADEIDAEKSGNEVLFDQNGKLKITIISNN